MKLMGISGGGNIHWYAANIRNGQWKRTGRRLEELGVKFYIPLTFNTLLFLCTTKEMALSLVNSGEIGAHFIIDRNTHSIMEVPDKQMEDFIKVLDLSPDAECLTQIPFRKGGKVRVIKGSLSGVEGEILDIPEGLFLIVSVCSLLCAKVEIPKSYVVAI